MTLLQRIGINWHPLTRLNLLISGFFVIFMSIVMASILFMPAAIDTRIVNVLLAVGLMWWFTSFACTVWMVWNAISLSWEAYRRPLTNPRRNLGIVWGAVAIMAGLIIGWSPLLNTITSYRLEKDFAESRSDFLVICERVLADGESSDAIQDDVALGVFEHVDILYRAQAVYFELGDDLRAYGYVCVAEGRTLPPEDDVYQYEPLDSRFYTFSEIENRLTPSDETPTPALTPEND